jgi:hypothetical protein
MAAARSLCAPSPAQRYVFEGSGWCMHQLLVSAGQHMPMLPYIPIPLQPVNCVLTLSNVLTV